MVDDICLALTNGSITINDLPRTSSENLGPLLELYHSSENSAQSWLTDNHYRSIASDFAEKTHHYQEGDTHLGRVAIATLNSSDDTETDFYIRSRRALEHSGFGKSEAAQIVGAINELYSNVIEHSNSIQRAYVAYAARQSHFEFVVADFGIGVLESLKSNPQYAKLGDSGSALELALTDGVSRHSGQSDRGRGFRSIFVGLANISQHVRFRSSDHAREMIRQSDGTIPSYTKQKSQLNGFFCSVTCSPGQ